MKLQRLIKDLCLVFGRLMMSLRCNNQLVVVEKQSGLHM